MRCAHGLVDPASKGTAKAQPWTVVTLALTHQGKQELLSIKFKDGGPPKLRTG
jgi:hypothetical protein